MELTAYARILRQRWRLVLLPFVAAAVIATLTAPDPDAGPAVPAVATFSATATLIATPPAADEVPLSLSTVALYATTGEIPVRAARDLNYRGEPQLLAAMVTVSPSSETGTITITATDSDDEAVAELVNGFAAATIDYFRDQALEQKQTRRALLEKQLTDTARALQKARSEQGSGSDPVLEARISALQADYSAQFTELGSLARTATTEQLSVLQKGVPIPQTTSSFAPPSSPWTRGGIAALLGLLLGAALALVVERLDSRMRTREQVEETLGLPVLAEIPLMPKRQRSGVASADRPASSVAEAFRGLRSSVLLLTPTLGGADGAQKPHRGSIVVMVTSAMPGAGKTTTAANVAAVMAEAGRKVLVLSLDLRNPSIHDHFGVPDGTGISELLAADRGRHLAQVVRETDVPGVSIVTSGHDTDHPGALLASVGPLIEAARALAEVVIIDVPPMLTVSDALDVARHADVTLLVSRLNKTTRSQADECQRLFKRLGVSALGTVLVGSRPAGARYGYPVVAQATEDGAQADPAQEESLAGERD